MTSEQMLIIAVTALAAVIVALWHLGMRQLNALVKRADACEEDREELWRHLARLEGKPVSSMRGTPPA